MLDVNSGHNLYLPSGMLWNKYLHDEAHRSGGLAYHLPLVIGDAYKLRLKTGAFDITYQDI